MAGLQLQAISYPPSSAVPGAIGHLVVETGWKEGLEKRASGRHALPHTQHSLSLETETTPSVGKTVIWPPAGRPVALCPIVVRPCSCRRWLREGPAKGRKGSGFLPHCSGETWFGSQGHHGGGLVRNDLHFWSASSPSLPCLPPGSVVTACCTGGPYCNNFIIIIIIRTSWCDVVCCPCCMSCGPVCCKSLQVPVCFASKTRPGLACTGEISADNKMGLMPFLLGLAVLCSWLCLLCQAGNGRTRSNSRYVSY
jgi:hypothetical protein